MSANDRFPPDTFESNETLGEFPPQEALQVLEYEHEKAFRDAPPGALTLEDLERLTPPRDRELILGLA
jgi:hypothetical protein